MFRPRTRLSRVLNVNIGAKQRKKGRQTRGNPFNIVTFFVNPTGRFTNTARVVRASNRLTHSSKLDGRT